MNAPKLHHYVPRLYLRNFADESGRLWVYDKELDRTFPTSPNKVAAEHDFYRLPPIFAGHEDSLLVEAGFADLESRAAPVLKRVLAQVRASSPREELTVSAQERFDLTEFVSWQYFRTLEMRELLSFLLGDVNAEFGTLDAEEQKVQLLKILAGAGVIEEMSESLHNAIWIFAKNGSRTPLATSDHPVCIKSHDSRTWVKGFAPLVDGQYIVLPLAPDVVMYCKERSKWEALRRFDCTVSPVILDQAMVEHENAGQAFAATRFIFSDRENFDDVRSFIPSIGTHVYATGSEPAARDTVERTANYLASRAARRRK